MIIPRWNIEEETGYKPFTTFWQDFSIADTYGLQAIQDTFNRAFDEWKEDYKYLTELVLVLNHKICTIMLRMAQMKKMIKLIFTINFGMKPTTTH